MILKQKSIFRMRKVIIFFLTAVTLNNEKKNLLIYIANLFKTSENLKQYYFA